MTVLGIPEDDGLLDEGDPLATPRNYRRALGQYATGVAVVTADHAGQQAYVTVNSFASVSLEPPLILWSLRRQSRSLATFRGASHFAVNVLSSDQVDLATRHASSSAEPKASSEGPRGRGGAPLLAQVAASFECRSTIEHDGGDHAIFVGEVEHYRCSDRTGLVFAQGRYAVTLDHPKAGPRIGFEHFAAHPLDDFLIPLLLRAYTALSAEFDRHRQSLGLDLDQSKVLAWLAAHPGGSAAGIARVTLLGAATAEESLAALIGKGFAAPRPPGAVVITDEGRRVVTAVLARAGAFQRETLAGFDPARVAAMREILAALARSS